MEFTRLCIYHDAVFYRHRPWFSHPETPRRLETAVNALRASGIWDNATVLLAPPQRDRSLALKVHSEEYVREVERASKLGRYMLDPDTYVVEETFDAALAVLASVSDAVERVVKGDCDVALVLGRPPGHHAGRNGAAMGAPTLGFCIFNGSALASRLLADRGYMVLHIDFDLHHGNGTQEILYGEPRVVHVDFHQDPATIYPGTGWPWETGEGEAKGTKINVVMPPGSSDDAFEKAIEAMLSILEAKDWKFDYLVYSAGFDAFDGDGLGLLHATEATYTALASKVTEAVKPKGIIVVWEGGYSIGLERGLPAFISALTGLGEQVRPSPQKSRPQVLEALRSNLRELCRSIDIEEEFCRV